MAVLKTEHPSPAELREFLLGQLPAAKQEEIEHHIDACDSCCEALRGIPDDTFVGRLKNTDTSIDQTAAFAAHPETSEPTDAVPTPLLNHARYRVIQQLGRGGMGAVYRAEHRIMERDVAIKVVNQSLVRHKKAVERFHVEVKAAAKLSHPNIVTAFDADQAENLHFLVMELVDGIDLDKTVKQNGPLPIRHACHFARQTAIGLQHAHEKGMVHRDIKPQNLMLTPEGRIKILDFGLARFASEATKIEGETVNGNGGGLTQDGVAVGTPDYMAPEQSIDASSADIRADIYSLGCTLYFLLTGQPPFPYGSAIEKMSAHLERRPQPLSDFRNDVPPALTSVIERMMDREPGRRFQTPNEVAEALAPLAKSGAPTVTPPPVAAVQDAPTQVASLPAETSWQPKTPWASQPHQPGKTLSSKRPMWLAGLAAVALVTVVGFSINGMFTGDNSDRTSLSLMSDEFDEKLDSHWQAAGEATGRIGVEASKLVIQPDSHTTLCGDGRGPAVFREVTGDFAATVHVTAESQSLPGQPPQQPMNLAGLFVRDIATDAWFFVGLGRFADSGDGALFADWEGENVQQAGPTRGELRVARFGSKLHILRRFAGESTWSEIREVPVVSGPVQVGLAAGSYGQVSDLRAEFDYARFRSLGDRSDLFRD